MPASGRSTNASPAYGGFDHNAQALRVVTALERRYPEFDGLNLTWETLEGIVKHNGPLTEPGGAAGRAHTAKAAFRVGIADFNQKFDLELWSYASLEAQVAAIADDIAYDAHDIDDGLRAGLFGVDDLEGDAAHRERSSREIDRHYPELDDARRGARTGARADHLHDRGRHGGGGQAARGARSRNRPTTSATTVSRWSPFRPRSRRRRPRSRRS